MELRDLIEQPLHWEPTGDAVLPLVCRHAGRRLCLRVNDFPEEPLFTLLIDDRPLADLEEWPTNWIRPEMWWRYGQRPAD